ncbi:MAG: DUF4159 domain-containing protein [Vicinamibacterales bacterium]
MRTRPTAERRTPRSGRLLVVTVALVLAAATAGAQFRRFGRMPDFATLEDFDGSFQFCRVAFRSDRNGDGGNWSVDWPRADENLSTRLSELTKTTVGRDPEGTPKHLLVRLTDPTLFRCPFIMMTEVGSAYIDSEEAAKLREYLVKGGFLWADDFWGEYAWAFWERQIRKALPSGRYRIVDLDPDTHPVFHTLMAIPNVPQIPSINFWGGVKGRTSERGRDSAVPHARAINDDRGRIMVLMTHNTDIGDSFEREGDSRRYFLEFSVQGYAFGVNTLLYAMTH